MQISSKACLSCYRLYLKSGWPIPKIPPTFCPIRLVQPRSDKMGYLCIYGRTTKYGVYCPFLRVQVIKRLLCISCSSVFASPKQLYSCWPSLPICFQYTFSSGSCGIVFRSGLYCIEEVFHAQLPF